MNIENVVQLIAGQVAQNPQMLTSLLEHPYSTIGNATNNNNVSKDEASQVVAAMSQLACGSAVDFGSLASMASGLLGQNGGSVHQLANSLLGAGSTQGVNVTNGIDAAKIANCIASGVDLSDGLGLDDIMRVAGKFLGGR
ncbi:MAG: hypothetical protein Q4D27_01630 [Coriobacteriia bacterium]|nr:hypothetical protein [Coriobacteriia bacterium]